MVLPFAALEFPEKLYSVRYRWDTLRPYMQKAFRVGMRPSEIYSEIVGTTLRMPTGEFYPRVNRLFEHWERATNAANIPKNENFLIGSLAQQQKVTVEERFWGIQKIRVRDSEGNLLKARYRTVSFSDVMTRGEIDQVGREDLEDSLAAHEETLDSVVTTELYKQW